MALQEEWEQQGLWLFKYRGFLPLIILLIGLVVYLRMKLTPGAFFLDRTPYEIYYETGCLIVGLIGFGIRVYTVGYTPKNTSGRNTTEQVADSLNTTGIYSMVRHPLYLGNFFMWLGPVLLTGNLWFTVAFVLFYWIYYERIMFAEEQFLRKKFGDTYLRWSVHTPAFLPAFGRYTKSHLTFSWKKVIKQEKNGLAALFLIFASFDALGETVTKEYEYNLFFMAGSLVTLVAYLVLKYMKRYTTLLNEADR
jgi:protein-S-isoprenylcysteine O-methyltransferase Ste14